jgi:hypothetical protein
MLAAQADHGQKREPGERTKAKKGLTSKDPLQKGIRKPPPHRSRSAPCGSGGDWSKADGEFETIPERPPAS